MTFSAIDRSMLEHYGFCVGNEIATRRRDGVMHFISPNGEWRVIHHMNNLDVKGQSSDPIAAVRDAKTAYHTEMWCMNSIRYGRQYRAPQH